MGEQKERERETERKRERRNQEKQARARCILLSLRQCRERIWLRKRTFIPNETKRNETKDSNNHGSSCEDGEKRELQPHACKRKQNKRRRQGNTKRVWIMQHT